ncbi:MAG: hypothetical protein LBJ46_05220 [Planctomycetota bacterium]|nr:hypothetical protein [Planctomycetota bacterium]
MFFNTLFTLFPFACQCAYFPPRIQLPDTHKHPTRPSFRQAQIVCISGAARNWYASGEPRLSVIERLKYELLPPRQWRFGKRSEKLEASGQLSLFPGVAAVSTEKEDALAALSVRKSRGRRPVPANLPVERIEIDVPAEELVRRPRGSEKMRIGEEIRRELEHIPDSILVREYVRPVCAFDMDGIEAMRPNWSPGRPPKLTSERLEEFRIRIRNGPTEDDAFPSWRGHFVRDVLRDEFASPIR